MRHKQLPLPMQKRLIDYYDYRFKKSYFRENTIFPTISGIIHIVGFCRVSVASAIFCFINDLADAIRRYVQDSSTLYFT